MSTGSLGEGYSFLNKLMPGSVRVYTPVADLFDGMIYVYEASPFAVILPHSMELMKNQRLVLPAALWRVICIRMAIRKNSMSLNRDMPWIVLPEFM